MEEFDAFKKGEKRLHKAQQGKTQVRVSEKEEGKVEGKVSSYFTCTAVQCDSAFHSYAM